MPRAIVLGNGNMLVNFDSLLNMRDLYYPFVGMENHIAGHKCRLGIWADGIFQWTDSSDWKRKIGYKKDSMVSEVYAEHNGLGIALFINDAVHYRESIFLKKIIIKSLLGERREIRFFLNNDLSISSFDVGDTALFDPATGALYHYKRDYYFLFNGEVITGEIRQQGFYQFSTGIKRFGNQEGTWRDAEDGKLEGHPIAQGSVDSVASFRCFLGPGEEAIIYYWLVLGRNLKEIQVGNDYVLNRTPEVLFSRIESYWRNWVNKLLWDFADLPQSVADLFKRSLLVIRTQIDNRGAILAANDTDIMATNRDHYSYLWPRDGAFVAHTLDKAGYPDLSYSFYRFCKRVLAEGGFFWPKYNPDGSVGSSWHPWFKNGKSQLPIQEDETALVIWALWEHYLIYRDFEFVKSLYNSLIKPTANFMANYRDSVTGLPQESYDLWEERRGVFTFTAAAVYGGLKAAAAFARLFGIMNHAQSWEEAAEEVREGILRYLYSEDLGCFIRGFYINEKGEKTNDYTLESSVYGIFEFGVLPADNPRVVRTMRRTIKGLWVKTGIGGIARYTDDYYFRRSFDLENVPGNPWFICTLWVAEWYIAKAKTLKELAPARAILKWITAHSMTGGLLSEQIHPYTGEPLSVAPLTWSHSSFVLVVLKYLQKIRCLKRLI